MVCPSWSIHHWIEIWTCCPGSCPSVDCSLVSNKVKACSSWVESKLIYMHIIARHLFMGCIAFSRVITWSPSLPPVLSCRYLSGQRLNFDTMIIIMTLRGHNIMVSIIIIVLVSHQKWLIIYCPFPPPPPPHRLIRKWVTTTENCDGIFNHLSSPSQLQLVFDFKQFHNCRDLWSQWLTFYRSSTSIHLGGDDKRM